MRRNATAAGAGWLLTAALLSTSVAAAAPPEAEKEALARLAREIRGAVVYTRAGRVRKVVIGEWRHVDLGEGDYARWSPDGREIAVWHRGSIYVMDADGSRRRKLVSGLRKGSGSPIEFHSNGREIIYVNGKSGLWSVNTRDGSTRSLELPANYTGEPGISADGTRLAARRGNALYAVDLVGKTHRKYAGGCSPGVSPDGKRLMNNASGHRSMGIRNWDGGGRFEVSARTCLPDRTWDNQHWSNHDDYIAAQGDRRREVYVHKVSENRGTRVTWEGKARYPDLYVAPTVKAPPRGLSRAGTTTERG